MSTVAPSDHSALLRRFQPQLKYDSNEAFFADSASEWTDAPGNVLRRTLPNGRAGEVIAYATPEPGQSQLSLDFLDAPTYGGGKQAESADVISTPRRDYREMYVALRTRGGYANRMYGHAQEDGGGRLWLQYWFYYFYNDYSLAGGIGLHEGDWEMIQLRMAPDGNEPDLAVYAQHVHAEKAPWDEVEREPGHPDTPLVYVARGSHASYFHAGYHETEAWYDMADGERQTPRLELEIIGEEVPGWLRWPGRWGDTRPRVPGIEQPSPDGPYAHAQWQDPQKLLDRARPHARPAARPKPEVEIRRRSGRLVVEFDFSAHRESHPERLVITVNSVDDKLPPRTFTLAVEPALRGTIETEIELREHQHYDVYVSTTDAEGRPSESRLIPIDPVSRSQASWQRILPRIGRLAHRWQEGLSALRRARR
jgi:hypothetical protein